MLIDKTKVTPPYQEVEVGGTAKLQCNSSGPVMWNAIGLPELPESYSFRNTDLILFNINETNLQYYLCEGRDNGGKYFVGIGQIIVLCP